MANVLSGYFLRMFYGKDSERLMRYGQSNWRRERAGCYPVSDEKVAGKTDDEMFLLSNLFLNHVLIVNWITACSPSHSQILTAYAYPT